MYSLLEENLEPDYPPGETDWKWEKSVDYPQTTITSSTPSTVPLLPPLLKVTAKVYFKEYLNFVIRTFLKLFTTGVG